MKINYKEKKFISPEVQESKDIEFMVEDTMLQFKKDILETKKELAVCQARLDDLKTNYPLDAQAIIDTQIEIENINDALDRMNKLSVELGFDEA